MDTKVFKSKPKAHEFMRKKVKDLYYNNIMEDEQEYDEDERRDTTPEAQYSNGHFFYERSNSITFREDREMGLAYRRSWGFVTIREAVVDIL
jgi:hypothetical protein